MAEANFTEALSAELLEAAIARIKWDADGLAAAIVQDAHTRQVLTLAYMNAESLRRTLALGETVFWSRSRGELWHKGATSGNIQTVEAIYADCDGDALLVLVTPAGPACHTGQVTCFYRTLAQFADEGPV
jgi:phosphoribosyl-ATP pyrophosphohydrolase/phosphoribosyl-AMP cyclohydrolase